MTKQIKTIEEFIVFKYNKYKEFTQKYPDNKKFQLAYYLYFELIQWYKKLNDINLLNK